MKLSKFFISRQLGEETILVAVGKAARTFRGMANCNETAGFIVEHLKKETTKEELLKAMMEEYEATPQALREGLDIVLNTLRSIGALEE